VSITVDANILIYASDEADPAFAAARTAPGAAGRRPDLVYLFWPTILGYLRIATHPGILPKPPLVSSEQLAEGEQGVLGILLARRRTARIVPVASLKPTSCESREARSPSCADGTPSNRASITVVEYCQWSRARAVRGGRLPVAGRIRRTVERKR
jgi:predicted nucleic acid-binding protein